MLLAKVICNQRIAAIKTVLAKAQHFLEFSRLGIPSFLYLFPQKKLIIHYYDKFNIIITVNNHQLNVVNNNDRKIDKEGHKTQ